MKKIILLLSIFGTLCSVSEAQRVQGTVRKASDNEVIVSIKPTAAFNALISNLVVSVQIPTSVGPRPTVTFTNLQPSLFASWVQLNADQGDAFYTWGFNCAMPGASNTDAAPWSINQLDVLRISFVGPNSAPFTARLCHYLDGGIGSNAVFYVETNLVAQNGGVLSNWGNLFYGSADVVNGLPAPGGIGVPNALYSYAPVANVVLPTKFLSFFATKSNDIANLTWTVDNEENNAYFEVERSLDGRSFTKAYQVQALRNGRASNSYTTPDANISRLGVKTIYYRIKQVEASGQIVYSDIRQVNLVDKNFSASLFPNPVKSNTTLVMDAPEAGKATVIIRDVAGKTIKSISLQLVKGINQQQLDASMFAAGDYNVTIVSEKMNQTIKMTKAN